MIDGVNYRADTKRFAKKLTWCQFLDNAGINSAWDEYHISPPTSPGLIWVRVAFLMGLSAGGLICRRGPVCGSKKISEMTDMLKEIENLYLKKMNKMYRITRLFSHWRKFVIVASQTLKLFPVGSYWIWKWSKSVKHTVRPRKIIKPRVFWGKVCLFSDTFT